MLQLLPLHRVGIFYRLLFSIAFILSCYSINAQATGKQKDVFVTYSGQNITLGQVFKAIKKQTGYSLMYGNNLVSLNTNDKVTVNFQKTPLEAVLSTLLKARNLTWIISDESIIIKKPDAPASQTMAGDSTIVTVSLSGKVTDAEGKGIPSATIIVKGAAIGTTTNTEGAFSLGGVLKNSTIIISSIGFETRELQVKGGSLLIKLNSVASSLDETVIIAYGTTTKRLNTGNTSTVKAKDIENQPVNNPLLALQGRVPGMFVTQSTGLPGSGVAVRIQGQNTLNFAVGNDPLYVIDGVPYSSRFLYSLSNIQGSSGNNFPDEANFSAGSGNPMSLINSGDIESIDILKDADATAIYGSRAANGAVLITTKKGKAGKTKIEVSAQSGWGKVAKFADLMNTQQYLEMRHEALRNEGTIVSPNDLNYDINGKWDTTRETDWQKVLIGGTAKYTDVQSSISGGNDLTQFLISSGYHKETTVFPGNLYDTKASLHFNINNSSANRRFQSQLSATYMVDNNHLMNMDITRFAVKIAPNAPALYKPDGSLNWETLPSGNSTWYNPLAYLDNKYDNKSSNLVASGVLSYKLLPNLMLRSSLGYTNTQSDQMQIFPFSAVSPEMQAFQLRRSEYSTSNINSWIVEPQVDYSLLFGKHKLQVLLGSTLQQKNSTQNWQQGLGYNSDLVINNIASAPIKDAINGTAQYKYNSLFSRITYNLRDKYVLNFGVRRDGSSRFGQQNQFHNFSSIAGAYIFSKESFIENNLPLLSFGKIRASYGTTGNDQIGDYRFLSVYSAVRSVSIPFQNAIGFSPDNLPNPYLAWEETRKLQLGLDLAFWMNKLTIGLNYFRNRSSNQLFDYALPIMTGFPGILQNFPALVENTGWEITASSNNLSSVDFSWTTNLNITVPRNKLVEFPNLETSSFANQLVIGQPVTITKALHYSGVSPQTGIFEFIDKDGKVTSNLNFDKDNYSIINTAPKLFGGLQNTITYKGMQLDFLFQFVKQKARQNYILTENIAGAFSGPTNSGNQPVSALNRWQKPGDIAIVQKFGTYVSPDIVLPWVYALASDFGYSDASYIRLKNLSISWSIPQRWLTRIHFENAKFFVLAQNVFTLTSYNGMDPETMSSTSLPPLRIITAGVKVGL